MEDSSDGLNQQLDRGQGLCLRQLGYPVLEINVADEQVDDALDDSLQLFYERHFDGVERVFLKYKLTDDDIERGRARGGDATWVSLPQQQHLEILKKIAITY